MGAPGRGERRAERREPELRTLLQLGKTMSEIASSHAIRKEKTHQAVVPAQAIPGYDREKVEISKRKLLDNGEGERGGGVVGMCGRRLSGVMRGGGAVDGDDRTDLQERTRESSDRGQPCRERRISRTEEKASPSGGSSVSICNGRMSGRDGQGLDD